MLFNWEQYLSLAQELRQRTESDQAAMRSAVSRAYYAAFNKAADRMEAEGEPRPTSGDSHRIVWEYYKKRPDRFRRQIGEDGQRLKRQRIEADYRGGVNIRSAQVEDCLIKAGRVLDRLTKLR